jgi:hypothetical protein
MMERTDPALWSSMISHLRHDLIKHLDIPKEGGTMSRPSWEVLRRRLYGVDQPPAQAGGVSPARACA